MIALSRHVIHAEYKCMACDFSEYRIVANGGAWPLKSSQLASHDKPYWHSHYVGINKLLHKMVLVSIFKLDSDMHTSLNIEDVRSPYEQDAVQI